MLLLDFFTPTGTSLRGLQQRSDLRKVQQRWGVARTGVSTVSEAATVFEAALLQDVSSEWAGRAWTQATQGHTAVNNHEQELLGDLGAVEGS